MFDQAVHNDVACIEHSHALFHEMIDYLQSAMLKGKSRAVIHNLMVDLTATLSVHVELENHLMITANFPLAASHIKEHESFRSAFLAQLQKAYDGIEVNGFAESLKGIHKRHIHYFDDVLKYYLEDKYSLHSVKDGLGI
ncbi:MAG: hypothetical protein WCK65_01870 [Rhodospirillaceae bacterium]